MKNTEERKKGERTGQNIKFHLHPWGWNQKAAESDLHPCVLINVNAIVHMHFWTLSIIVYWFCRCRSIHCNKSSMTICFLQMTLALLTDTPSLGVHDLCMHD